MIIKESHFVYFCRYAVLFPMMAKLTHPDSFVWGCSATFSFWMLPDPSHTHTGNDGPFLLGSALLPHSPNFVFPFSFWARKYSWSCPCHHVCCLQPEQGQPIRVCTLKENQFSLPFLSISDSFLVRERTLCQPTLCICDAVSYNILTIFHLCKPQIATLSTVLCLTSSPPPLL